MTPNNLQGVVSSRIYTNKVLQSESRKVEPVQREKMIIYLANINNINNKYDIAGNGLIDETNNIVDSPTKKTECLRPSNKQIEEDELEKKTLSFDEKIFKNKTNSLYISCNRLLYSKNCIYFYIGLLVVSILILLYSIFCYFAKLSKYILIN